MVNGTEDHAHALREDIATVLAPLGLRLSESKTRIAHLSEGVDFLGSTSSGDASEAHEISGGSTPLSLTGPSGSSREKIRALTPRSSQRNPEAVLIRLNQILRGWSNYFKHAVASKLFRKLENFVWHRVISWLKGWTVPDLVDTRS